MTLNITFLKEFILICFIKLFIEYKYNYFVFYYYESEGYKINFNMYVYISGWIIFIGLYYILHTRRKIFIYDFYLFIFILWCLPNIVIYSFHNHNLNFLLILLVPYAIIILATFNIKAYEIKKIRMSKPLILLLSLILIGVSIFNYILVTKGNIVFNLANVYEHREKFDELSSQGIFGYLNSSTFKIFCPLLFAWAIHKKNTILIYFSIVLIILLFAFSGHKSVLISLFVVPFFYFLYKFKNIPLVIILGFLSLLVSSSIIGWIINSNMPESLIIRRLFIVPAMLNFTYLEYFSNNQNIYWSNSVLSYFINYPYDDNFVYLIGDYLGLSGVYANTGFIASGFAHASIFGVIIYTFIGILIFNFINIISKNNQKYFVMSIIFIPLSSMFISSDLPTSLLTHGVLIAIFSLYLYNEKTYCINTGFMHFKI